MAISPALSSQQAASFLQQAQFSSTPEEIEQLKQLGLDAWLERQIALPIATTGWQQGMADFAAYKTTYPELTKDTMTAGSRLMEHVLWHQLVTQPDTLRKRVALALSEILVVSVLGVSVDYASFALLHYWDILNQYALGNYRDLLQALSTHYAMGTYLSFVDSQKHDAATGRSPDENYARELMQLFTIGLVVLNLDGTPKTTANGQTIETYNQQHVIELAKVFTGFVLDDSQPRPESYRLPLRFVPERADTSVKRILNADIPADVIGVEAISKALDALFSHPNVAPFISRQLIQRLVSSNPSAAYIKRVARVFNDNGQGVKGDLAAVTKAILLDKEARNPKLTSTHGKVREPMLTLVQLLRSYSSKQSVSGLWLISGMSNGYYHIAQSPLAAGSVFNFFRPDYSPVARSFVKSSTHAPELALINSNTLASYQNYLLFIFYCKGLLNDQDHKLEIPLDLSSLVKIAGDVPALVNELNLVLCAGSLSEITQSYIRQAVLPLNEQARAEVATWMTLISPDYRVQK